MSREKAKKRTFSGMSYCEVQRANSTNRIQLQKADQKWLKQNGYRNTGWDNVINLHQKIQEFLEQYKLGELTLEDLFLEADRIGNKYLTHQEREEFNQKLAKEVNGVSEEIDRQFPDTEVEIVDFSKGSSYRSRKKREVTRHP